MGSGDQPCPASMITQGVREVCAEFGYTGAIQITVSVRGGEEVAKRTFNPHLGILGGISILGTSGIVVPMSEQALIDSIRIEMRQKVQNGERHLLITPGNYGADFLKGQKQYELLRPEHLTRSAATTSGRRWIWRCSLA
ncbi:MAG: cobalt-precorrin-5B (C(1))-methyltransferase [Lachnospiraceae bacterium]